MIQRFRSMGWPAMLLVCCFASVAALGQQRPTTAGTTLPRAGSTAPQPGQSPGPYVLQRGDDIEIKVFNMPELAEAARIRPDGKISALLLNDVQAAGLTPAQLGEFLSAEYGKQFRNPRVTVIVRNFSSETVFVGGEVAQPGILPLRGELRIAQAIFQAGGVRETGRLDNVVLVRNENGQAVATRINLLKVMKAGRGNLPLQPFDIVYVPKTKVAKVDQFVRQYIRDAVPASLNAGFSYLLGATVLR